MKLSIYRSVLAITMVCLFNHSALWGQVPEDCAGAVIICSDEVINFNPNGIGMDDFANPNNDEGCLLEKEKEGLWFYFSFRTDMPPDSKIEFTLIPAGQNNEDYDFAIYGPDLTCDSLGSPLRCSFFDQVCYSGVFNTPFRCPETGVGRGATDFSEPYFYENENHDGFVAPIVVQPGEGFYMFLDNFGTTARAFELIWGGSAAPYLNCLADPICNSKKVDAGPDENLCFDETLLPIQTTLTNTTPEATISWSAEPAIALTFLNDPNIREPLANIPLSFSGEIIYTLTVIDEGCEKIDKKRVFVNRPDVTINGLTPFCDGTPNVLSVPEGYASYLWSTGDTTHSIVVYRPELYSVEIMDTMGCIARGEIEVSAFAPLIFEVEGPDTICLNEEANLRSSTDFIAYEWSTGATSQNIFVSKSGIYHVTATDINGCIYTDSLSLNEWDSPEPVFSGDDSFCTSQTGTIIANPGFVAYEWSTGDTTEMITVSEGGTYTVTVTDSKACEGVGAFEIEETLLPRPIIEGTLNICSGTSTELSVDADVRSILWSTGDTTKMITVSEGDTISVMVEDNLGCQGVDTVIVTENALPEILVQGEKGFCPEDSVTLDPGQEFLQYQWSTLETTSTITVNQIGIYGLTVTDANGCEASGDLQVVQYSKPSFTLSNDFTFCRNDSTQISVDKDFPAYDWSDGRAGQSLFFGQAGNYSVTVTNDKDCSSSMDFDVLQDTLPVVKIGGDLSICENGSTTINAPPGYKDYLWSTGERTETIDIDTAGFYSLSVSDFNNCVGLDSIEIIENTIPTPKFSGIEGICPGGTTQVSVIGGYQSYLWSNGDTTAQTSFSQADTYGVTVTDNQGCEGSSPIEIVAYNPPNPEIAGKDAFCQGYTSVLRVTGNYESYKWSTQGERYLTIINEVGTYGVTVTDDKGCQGSDEKEVKVNPRPILTLTGEPSYCEGESTVIDAGPGYVDYIWSTGSRSQMDTLSEPDYFSVVVRDTNNCLTAAGLTIEEKLLPEPIIIGDSVICEEGGATTLMVNTIHDEYKWSTGDTTQMNEVTQEGLYSITVTNSNNCQGETSFEVKHQPNPDPVISGELGFCIGANTEISVDSGFVSYLWSTGETGNRVVIDMEDTYGITVTDSLGCVGDGTFLIEEYQLPVVDLDAVFEVCPDVVVSIDGGAGFVEYLWSNGGTDRFLESDTAGYYALTVTDVNGCMDSTSTILTDLDKPEIMLPDDLIVCPGEIVVVEADSGFVSYSWSNGDTGRVLTTRNLDKYILTVEDINGCETSDSISLFPFDTETPEILGVDTVCVDQNSLLSVRQDFVTYRWEYLLNNDTLISNDTSQLLRITGGGQFISIVTDVNGCETRDSIVVVEIPLPVFEFEGDKSLCEGVQAVVSVSPEFPSYFWSDGSTEGTVIFTDAGNYSVRVKDEYGCEASKSIILEEKAAPVVIPGPDIEFPCIDSTTQIGGSVTPDGDHLIHIWVGPGITTDNYQDPNPIVALPGEYFHLVRDTITGCQSEIDPVKVFSGAGEYKVHLAVGDNVDCETQTVELDASRSEKADSLIFQWLDSSKVPIDGGTTPTVGVNSAGWYYVETLLFDTRCARTDSILVRPDFLVPRAFAGRDQPITCDQSVITLDAGASSGGVGISYDWLLADGNATLIGQNQQLMVDQPGEYILVVTNQNNGCSDRDTVQVRLDQQLPNVSLDGDKVLDCLLPTAILDGSASQSGENIVYRWIDKLSGNQLGEQSNQLTVSQAGHYQLIVENKENGCTSSDSAEVIDNIAIPEIIDINFGAPVCADDQSGFITIERIEGGKEPYSYSFDGKDGAFTPNPEKNQLSGGIYSVVVEDATGCQTEQIIELANGNFVEIDLGRDQVIQLGEQAQVEAKIRSGKPAILEWLSPEEYIDVSPAPFVIVEEPVNDRTFIAMATDEDGCTAVDTAFVKVLINREVYIPNIFRPLDAWEANNSRFTVFGSSQIKEVKLLRVFDRWGGKVFENNNFKPNEISFGWDGTFQGEDVTQGVFVYQCEVIFLDGDEVKLEGDVTLVR